MAAQQGNAAVSPGAVGCCGGRGALTFSDYIDRGLRRRRRSPLPIHGHTCIDETGRSVQFTLLVQAGLIVDATFAASHCVALIACCEMIAERILGSRPCEAARELHVADFVAAVPSLPAAKRGAAVLALQAAVDALAASLQKD